MPTENVRTPRTEILITNVQKGKIEPTSRPRAAQVRWLRLSFSTLGLLFPRLGAWEAYKIFSHPLKRARHKRSDALIESARVSDLPYKDFHLKVYEWGEGERVVLLAHGWESRGTALRMFVPELLKNGFKIVAFDAPAHGDSGGSWNNLPNNAAAMVAVMSQYEGRVYAVIAHSFGCSSLIYALQFLQPQLRIERVVFAAVPHSIRRIMTDYLAYIRAPRSLQARFYAMLERITKRSLDELDIAHAAPKVQIGQLLLLHDRYDKVTSLDAAERVVQHWDHAQLLITEGFGHFNLVKNPDVIARVQRFIVS